MMMVNREPTPNGPRPGLRAVLGLVLVASCTGDSYLVVTVNARPAVHGATTLKITQQNAGTMRTDTLALGSHTLPITFSVSAPGRSGEIDFAVEAHAVDDQLVGLGSGSATLDLRTAAVMLEAADFVVNTDYAGDQYLSTDFEANGLQLAATTDGSWTTTFGSTCTDACNIFGRRFDATGSALKSVIAAGTNNFPLATTLTTSASTSAVATAGVTTLVFWDNYDTVGTGHGVACRALDPMGNATPGQLEITTDAADVVTASSLSNGNVAVSWQVYTPTSAIHSTIVKPDCTTVISNPVTMSTTVGVTSGPHRSHIASNLDKVLYAWVIDDDVHVRASNNLASIVMPEATFLRHSATQALEAVRLAPLGAGFAVVVRWAANDGTSPGMIELYLASATGAMLAGPILITAKSGSSFIDGFQSFGVAARSDGAVMIVWHQCDNGAAGTCDVYGRVVRPSGVPVGDPFMVPTETENDQVNPAVTALPGAFAAAWNDSSHTAPDTSGTAVRARIIYPPYDDATAILGARCGGMLPPCNAGLACAMGSDSLQRCYESCTPPTCPDGGTCSQIQPGTYACTF